MRIIDADALRAAMYHEAFENDASYDEKNPLAKWDSGLWVRYKMFERCLESATSIDSVPVVRCKDCKYNLNNDRLYADPDPIMTYAWCNTEAFQENDFCSKGKEKT